MNSDSPDTLTGSTPTLPDSAAAQRNTHRSARAPRAAAPAGQRRLTFVVAPDSFKESLTQTAAATAIAAGIHSAIPDARILRCPVSDGGEGFLQAVEHIIDLERIEFPTLDPLRRPITGTIGIDRATNTAFLEAADTLGMARVPQAERDIMRATSDGLGISLRAALDAGVDKIVLGLGGTVTNDGGAGMAAALGAHFFSANGKELDTYPGVLAAVARVDFSELDPRLQDVQITCACDVDNPLTGPEGASRIFAAQKGATPEQLYQLDDILQRLSRLIDPTLATAKGAGAAGGIGFMLSAIAHVRTVPGIELFIEETGLLEQIAHADFVFTGEGKTDLQTAHGKAPLGIAKACQRYGVPCINLTGTYEFLGQPPIDPTPFAAVVPILPRVITLPQALDDARANLTQAAATATRLLATNLM